jgi:hypothetical protein
MALDQLGEQFVRCPRAKPTQPLDGALPAETDEHFVAGKIMAHAAPA